MKLIDIYAEILTYYAGVTKEEALTAARETCPSGIDPDYDVPEMLVPVVFEGLNSMFQRTKAELTKMAH